MKTFITAFVISLIGVAHSLAAGTTSGSVLNTPSGARAAGMAEAFTSMGEDVNAMAYNPAGLGTLKKTDIQTMYLDGLVDNQTLYLGVGHPVGKGSLGFHLFYLNGGDIQLGTLSGNTIVTQTKKAQQEYVGAVGYGWPLTEKLNVGLSLKLIHSELVEEFSATAVAGDGGFQYQTPLKGFKLGAALQNVGSKLEFDQEGDSLPLTLRVGSQYSLPLATQDTLTGAFDVLFPKEEEAEINVGAEYVLRSLLALRLGYGFDTEDGSDQISGFTTGVGFQWGLYQFDYAFGLMDEFDNRHLFSVGAKF